jgi:acetylserotonin N-methyltransferase
MTPPVDPAPIIDLIEAFRRSKTLFTAVARGVFEERVSGPKAASTETEARLLDACVSFGLLTRDGDLYANSPAAERYLVRSSPDTLAGYILYSDRVLWRLWTHLSDAIDEGTHRWTQAFGFKGALFDHFFRTEEEKEAFLLGMHGLGRMSSPAVAAAFDLSRFRRLVDLGGATGHLPITACERYPELSAAVFDLPLVIDYARRFTEGTRVELIAGDFFNDDLPPADLYSLGRILHDWGEDKIRRLLARIHAALPAGGGLLIAEKLLDDDLAGPVSAHMQSLNMLVNTEGRERSFEQYADLLTEAGFSEIQGHRTGTPLDAILAIK